MLVNKLYTQYCLYKLKLFFTIQSMTMQSNRNTTTPQKTRFTMAFKMNLIYSRDRDKKEYCIYSTGCLEVHYCCL
jgi:hypothetical protein